MITVIGLGVCGGDLTLRALRRIQGAEKVFLRTARHDTATALKELGIEFETLDALYDVSEDFDALYAEIGKRLAAEGEAVYCVPGGAYRGELSVCAVVSACIEAGVEWEIIPGVASEGYAAALYGGVESLTAVSANDEGPFDPRRALAVLEIDSRRAAGELKLRLMERYPDEQAVFFNGKKIPLHALDRLEDGEYNVDASLLVPPLGLMELERYDFAHLMELVSILRDPLEGCPWDREQTHESLVKFLIEEAYETADAIERREPLEIADELGDVLLQIALHAQIGAEHGAFNAIDVSSAICRKMISRHTHIFGNATAHTAAEVSMNWEANKRKEKQLETLSDALLEVPRGLPPLLRAEKVLKRLRGLTVDYSGSLSAETEAFQAAGENLYAAIDRLIARVSETENIEKN